MDIAITNPPKIAWTPWIPAKRRKSIPYRHTRDVHGRATRGCFDGLRHDSGDPIAWGEKALAHYRKLRIEPATKRLVFSDGLDVPRVLQIYDAFADRVPTGFGIGTNFTNDVGQTTLQIVMKLVSANGQTVAKLSDSPGKVQTKDETFLAYLRQVFNVQAPAPAPEPAAGVQRL